MKKEENIIRHDIDPSIVEAETKRIDDELDKLVEERYLNRIKWNRAIRIHNKQNFFGAEKAIYSVKFDSKNNIWYYILRVDGTKEPTIYELAKPKEDRKYLFLTTKTKSNHVYVLGQIIERFEL